MFINVFYQTHINYIGGVETFLYELARLSCRHKRDLTIIYRTGDYKQIQRLKKYCRTMSLDEVEKPIKCKRAFFNYGLDAISLIDAEEYIQLIHADFKDESLKNYPLIQSDKIDRYYSVSINNGNSYKELTGRNDIEVLYNPIYIDKEPRIMTLVTAQRMTGEKGCKRLEYMIEKLDNSNISYIWHIFSNTELSVKSENVVYHKPTLDIRKWIKYADYGVLLSDTEGFSYFAYESLCLGTPLIITKLPVLSELGCNSKNSIILEFDMSNLNVKDIYKKAGKFKFDYKQKDSEWLNILEGESTYVYNAPNLVKLKAVQKYHDVLLDNRLIEIDTEYDVPEERAKKLVDLGFAEYIKDED